MSIRFPLAAAMALVGLSSFAAPAFAAQTITIPDPRVTNSNGAAPDALFDNSIPDTWQKKGDSADSLNKPTGFHFSVRGSNEQYQPASDSNSTSYHDPRVPGSEFYQPLPSYSDPYLPR